MPTTPTPADRPADLLRAAAELLREAAGSATPGPWRTHDTHLGGTGGHTATVLTDRPNLNDTELIAWLPTMSHEPWDEARNAWRNAGWMALLHPGVGLALVDWLDRAAVEYDATVRGAAGVWSEPGEERERDAWVGQQTNQHALAVARQLLGTTGETTAASCPGYEASPNLCRCPCYGCQHNCSAHQPPAALPVPLSRVWTVWVEDESTLGHCADEVTAKLAAIEHHQESETPGLEFVYGWNERGGHLELLADGDDTGIRVKCSRVHGAPPAPADRAAVLRELEAKYRQHSRDSVHPDFRAAYAAVANDMSRLAGEAAAGAHHPSPRIRCAHTDVLYGQCVRYLDDHDGDCQHEHQPTPAAPAAPEEIQ